MGLRIIEGSVIQHIYEGTLFCIKTDCKIDGNTKCFKIDFRRLKMDFIDGSGLSKNIAHENVQKYIYTIVYYIVYYIVI